MLKFYRVKTWAWISGAQLGVMVKETLGNVWRCARSSRVMGDCYWHLVHREQEFCYMPYKTDLPQYRINQSCLPMGLSWKMQVFKVK